MSSIVSAGRQRPPPPSVEDETESIARELLDPSITRPRDDDGSECSRGTVDQYPVILAIDDSVPSPFPMDACPSLAGSRAGSISSSERLSSPAPASTTSTGAAAHLNTTVPSQNTLPSAQVTNGADVQQRGNATPPRCHSSSPSRENGHQRTSPQYRCPTTGHSSDPEDNRYPRRHLNRHSYHGPEGGHGSVGQKIEWQSDGELHSSHYGPDADKWGISQNRKPVKKRVGFVLPGEPAGRYYESGPGRQQGPYPGNADYSAYRNDVRQPTPETQDYYRRASEPLKLVCVTQDAQRSGLTASPAISPLSLSRQSPLGQRGLAKDTPVPDSSPTRRNGPFPTPQLLPSYSEVTPYLATEDYNDSSQRPPSYKCIRTRSSSTASQVSTYKYADTPPPYNPLSPCPRSIPMAGYQDWYTIMGMTHLDICPSCMGQIGYSRFRDLFIPSLPKPRDAKVRCSLSQTWARLAWVQTMKLGLNHLELLYQITRPPPGHRPCSGRTPSTRTWYGVADSESRYIIPNFSACSACVRNLQILVPYVRGAFRSVPLPQERICDLRTDSPRFVRYLDLLDAAAMQSKSDPRGHLDLRHFMRYVKRKNSMHDCSRDHLRVGPWHYIPELPQFTICEDCYDDVVWPLSDTPLGTRVSSTLQRLPGRDREASCQLFSPRMRAMFRDAAQHGDFTYLKAVALRRYDAEMSFRERKRVLLEDAAQGYDCDVHLRKNAEDWKMFE
ncbi:hypothetical protein AJ80_01332 [Polytolypa hystricis UAMH7299]|uniref:Uncharacterized protein n=1 Tax=Polytolypa hystricis (strain UAMH7299) TaxID=1447883 RepID=A0A2B7Z131_POLH7|nr:hypothetical protein AJ80_01332 [Polytolypa hystricis UAMH7299]